VNGMIIRPLLCIGKEDIMMYIQEFNLPFVTDASNFSTDIIRNKIRHELIPLAESINPSFRKTMVETMHHFRESTNLQHIYFQSVKESIVQQKDEEVRISIPAFQKSGGSVTLLHHFLKEYSFNPRLTNKIVRALDSEAGKLFYSPTHCLVKDRSELIIHPLNLKTNSNTDFEVTVFAKDDRFTLSTHPGIIHLDADQIRFPLQLRTWKAGDYFCPLGMKNKKKISDFLTDLKINRLEKKHIQVLTDGTDSRILWVVGYRIDDRYRVKSSTTTIAEIKLKKS
jgi:tRNA(Ile)-lysidine synthase